MLLVIGRKNYISIAYWCVSSRLPVDNHTPVGYAIEFSIQLGIGLTGFASYCIILTFFSGSCAYIYTFISDAEDHFKHIYGNNQTDAERLRLPLMLKEHILLHAQIHM